MKNTLEQQSPTFLAPGTCLVQDNFSMDLGGRYDSSTLQSLGPLFLLLLHQLHLRSSSGIRSWTLVNPALEGINSWPNDTEEWTSKPKVGDTEITDAEQKKRKKDNLQQSC